MDIFVINQTRNAFILVKKPQIIGSNGIWSENNILGVYPKERCVEVLNELKYYMKKGKDYYYMPKE